jgi:hypothetical protein
MRWWRPKRGDADMHPGASMPVPLADLVEEIGAPLEAAFARLDAQVAINSARRMLEPYTTRDRS